MSTLSDQVERLEVLLPLIEDGITISPRYECKIDPRDLPTFIIVPGAGRRERMGAHHWSTTRDFLLLMLVLKAPDTTSEAMLEAREACYPYLDLVPQFFVDHEFLELDGTDTGLPGVIGTTLPREDGSQLTDWGGDKFAAIAFRMSITSAEEG